MSTPSPTPSSVTPTPTVSPTPALSSCASSQNWPYNMAATAALSAATSYCTSIVSLLPQMPNGPGSCAVPNLSPPYNPPGNSDICADQGDITFSAGLDTSVEACKSYPFTFSSSDCTTALTSVINDCRLMYSIFYEMHLLTINLKATLVRRGTSTAVECQSTVWCTVSFRFLLATTVPVVIWVCHTLAVIMGGCSRARVVACLIVSETQDRLFSR